jgi:ArsR family transcriptional regulator
VKILNKEDLAQIFKALGDQHRLTIIKYLYKDEKCVCELIEKMNLSQPALSHHLKILKQAGLLKDRREGKWIFYSVNHKEYKEFLDLVNQSLDIKTESYEAMENKESKIICD